MTPPSAEESSGASNLNLKVGRVQSVRCKQQLLQCPAERRELVRVAHTGSLPQGDGGLTTRPPKGTEYPLTARVGTPQLAFVASPEAGMRFSQMSELKTPGAAVIGDIAALWSVARSRRWRSARSGLVRRDQTNSRQGVPHWAFRVRICRDVRRAGDRVPTELAVLVLNLSGTGDSMPGSRRSFLVSNTGLERCRTALDRLKPTELQLRGTWCRNERSYQC